jgi:hypothetical protein
MKAKLSSRMITLIGLFDANVALSDEVQSYVNSLNSEARLNLHEEFSQALKRNSLGCEEFYSATSCIARNEKLAQKFFKDVYAYAFENGEEPDIENYWNR